METLITFDVQQIQKLEQIIMDHDEIGAMRFLEELNRKIKQKKIGCNPLEFRTKEGIEGVIDQTKKKL